MDNLALE
ncbi:hypothetical protein D047_3791A, partial [Vibrio parahaemolyticus VPTS-2010_2]